MYMNSVFDTNLKDNNKLLYILQGHFLKRLKWLQI